MSNEDPGDAGSRPATPAWPPSAADARDAASIPTPVRTESSAPYEDVEEDFEQFDWDSWEPGEIGDDGPTAAEVDWDAVADPTPTALPPEPVLPVEPTSWREKVINESDWARAVVLSERDPTDAGIGASVPPSPRLVDTELQPVASSLAEPLAASGGPWPPASAVSHDVVHVRVAPWAPFTTGLALAVAMVLVSAAILSQTGRLGLTLAVLTGQVPTSADAVVDAYLTAISRGDASKAMSYLSSTPTNAYLLTDQVLQRSNEINPLRIVTVKAGPSDISGTQRVSATYMLGDVEVSTSYTTAFAEGQWVIRDDPGRIGVGSLRAAGLPLFINGEKVPDAVDSLAAFPGTYELSTQSSYIDFTSPGVLMVKSADEAPVIGAVKLELTDAGRQVALSAVKSAVAACLAKKELAPKGCPQNIEPFPNQPVQTDTIAYTTSGDQVTTVSDSNLRQSMVMVSYMAWWVLTVKVDVNGTLRDQTFRLKVSALWQVPLNSTTPVATLVS